MSNETLFFVFGIALAVSAVLVSIAGLRMKDLPGRAFPVVVLWFTILVGGATTFAVLHAKDEKAAKSAEFEQAGKEIEKETSSGPYESGASEESEAEPEAAAKGPGGTLQLAADPTNLAFDKSSLTSKPGKVTIDFTNPSSLEHDVAIEGSEGKEIAVSQLIGESETSVSANLAAGTYTFFCTVPGHREAGMEGTLVVK
ncbi:MAG TPA: plastocyanin/azurin family copper-binding protein [Solirubrobacterales bacterium]|jgi:plastocyanin|nr:plastocyanin/azurin family copper-binding protein [Solirubrobacterales bacterium]